MERKVKRFVELFVETKDDGSDFFPLEIQEQISTPEKRRQWVADALSFSVADKALYSDDDVWDEMNELSADFYRFLGDNDFCRACEQAAFEYTENISTRGGKNDGICL